MQQVQRNRPTRQRLHSAGKTPAFRNGSTQQEGCAVFARKQQKSVAAYAQTRISWRLWTGDGRESGSGREAKNKSACVVAIQYKMHAKEKTYALKPIAIMLLLVIFTVGSISAQTKVKVCVWVDSESPGSVMAKQSGGSVKPITKVAVSRIQQMAANRLRIDASNTVLDPCPQTGENVELDVVVGQFHGFYVASISTTIQREQGAPSHVSSNVIAANSEKDVAEDIAMAYESLKIRMILFDAKN